MNDETLRTADLWRSRGDDVALATVVRTRLLRAAPSGREVRGRLAR